MRKGVWIEYGVKEGGRLVTILKAWDWMSRKGLGEVGGSVNSAM